MAAMAVLQGVDVATIRRHLKRLQALRLAQKTRGTWVALERDPKEVAEELGTAGMAEHHARCNASDSQKFGVHLKMREEEGDRVFRELEEAGHVWVGRYKNFLVPPERGSQKKRKQTTPTGSRKTV